MIGGITSTAINWTLSLPPCSWSLMGSLGYNYVGVTPSFTAQQISALTQSRLMFPWWGIPCTHSYTVVQMGKDQRFIQEGEGWLVSCVEMSVYNYSMPSFDLALAHTFEICEDPSQVIGDRNSQVSRSKWIHMHDWDRIDTDDNERRILISRHNPC